MEDIKVGELVRTNNGFIGKVNKIEVAGRGVRFGGEYLSDTIIQFNDGKIYERRVKGKDITKHSFNLIDLIEVRDIVFIQDVLNNDFVYIYDDEILKAVKEDVESGLEITEILTYEQFEKNCYKVK